jgi:hypothetical protein
MPVNETPFLERIKKLTNFLQLKIEAYQEVYY